MVSVVLWRLVRGVFAYSCRHDFRNSDLSLTGIAIPVLDKTAGYDAGLKYFAGLSAHPSHTHRVQWPCAKCGKLFFAHCGLDVLAGRGTSSSPNAKASEPGT